MLKFHELSVRLGGKQILEQISFRLQPGRITALVGRNGSGKSTLLSCVNRQIPYSGEIILEETPISRLSPRQRAKKIAILPQHLPRPHVTAAQMVRFGRNPHLDLTGHFTPEDTRAVARAMADAHIEGLACRYADTLSGGEFQRVALAMLLAQGAPIMLLDEPTAHMDQSQEAALLQLLAAQRDAGKTVLAVLHDLTQAVRYADELLVLEDGRLVFSGSREACLEQNILEKTFQVRRYTVTENGNTHIFFQAE